MERNNIVLQNRLKSPIFWVGLISAVAFFAKSFFQFELPQEQLNLLVEAVLGALTAFGVINVGTYKNHI